MSIPFKFDRTPSPERPGLSRSNLLWKRPGSGFTPFSWDMLRSYTSSSMGSSSEKEAIVQIHQEVRMSTDRIPEVSKYFDPQERASLPLTKTKRQKRGSLKKIPESNDDVFEIGDREVSGTPRGSTPALLSPRRRRSNRRLSSERGSSSDDSNSTVAIKSIMTLARWRSRARNKNKVPPLVRFRRIGRVVLICVAWCRYSYQRAEETKDQFLSVTQFVDEPIVDRKDLLFDLSTFKATRQERLSQEARRILQLRPEDRTEKDLRYLQIALRNINAFAEYPRRMQKALCRVGWYESYESKRAIVRQGHQPVAFYYILSGTVVVTVYDEEAQVARTICFLHRGMEFGELALVTKSIRQATVISKTAVELLCISVEDFEDIFMSGGMKNVLDPDHVSFLENIPFLQDWPVHKLSEEPRRCLFHYFNRGQVLVRDSNFSDWIYIVKSGSLSVMKKLKNPSPPDLNGKKTKFGEDASFTPRRKKKRKSMKAIDKEMLLHPPRTKYEWQRRMEETLPGIYDLRERLGTIDYDKIIEEKLREYNALRQSHHSRLPPLAPTSVFSEEVGESGSEKEDRGSEGEEAATPRITKTPKGVFFSTSRHHAPKTKTRKEIRMMKSKKLEALEEKVRKGDDTIGRKTLADDLDNKPSGHEMFTDADVHPAFITVQVLERGQYFGVSQLLFSEQPSLSIVSNGAECIMISKKFFREHLTEAVIRQLRQQEVPYPQDEEMQENLQNSVNWEKHRAKTYKSIVELIEAQKLRKRQLLPSYVEHMWRNKHS